MVHQRKGGIHDSNRIFMGTFGWYRLTGLLHQNIWKTPKSVSGHQVYLVAFLFYTHSSLTPSRKLINLENDYIYSSFAYSRIKEA
jgi:hypothetical protein